MSKSTVKQSAHFDDITEEQIPEDSHQEYNDEFERESQAKDEDQEEQEPQKNEDEEEYNQDNFDLDDEDHEKGEDNQEQQEESIHNKSKMSSLSHNKDEKLVTSRSAIAELPKVEYKKNNYLLFLREVSGGKYAAQKDRPRQVGDSNQFKVLIYYRLGDKNWIEGKLRTMIEVPFERNQTEEEIEFKLITIDQDTEISVKQKFKLHELNLTKQKPCDTFVCKFDSREEANKTNSIFFKFALIFDATVLSYAEGFGEKSIEQIKAQKQAQAKKLGISSKTSQASQNVVLLSFTLKDMANINEFIKQRKQFLKNEMILTTSTHWYCRYLLDVQLAKQKCQVYLDDPERDDLYLFYTRNMGSLKVQLVEQVYETFQLDNYGQITYSETKMKSESPLGPLKEISVDDLIGKAQGYQQFDESFNQNLSIKFNVSMIPEKTQFHNKFLGYTSIKILETVIFNDNQQPTHMEVSLFSMDNELISQVWRLKPFSHYNQNVQRISTWDYQHDLVYKKNTQDAEENVDVSIPEELFKRLLVTQLNLDDGKL